MGVLLNSGDLARVLNKLSEKSDQIILGEFITICEPMIEFTARKFPLYMRDDLKQEVRMDLMKKADGIASEFKGNKIGDIMRFMMRLLMNSATDYSRTQVKIECKLVRIDDVQVEAAIYPKNYEKTKLLKRLRLALEFFYKSRYPNEDYGDRASRFAYIMLTGKRPTLTRNNLCKFFNMSYEDAKMAYTTALVVIRQLLERHHEEVDCARE